MALDSVMAICSSVQFWVFLSFSLFLSSILRHEIIPWGWRDSITIEWKIKTFTCSWRRCWWCWRFEYAIIVLHTAACGHIHIYETNTLTRRANGCLSDEIVNLFVARARSLAFPQAAIPLLLLNVFSYRTFASLHQHQHLNLSHCSARRWAVYTDILLLAKRLRGRCGGTQHSR